MKPIQRCVLIRKTPVAAAPAKPYVERLPKFGPLQRFEMVVEWHPSVDKNPRIQRLGFKAAGNFLAAVEDADRFVAMMNRMYGRTLKEISEAQFCRLVAVYEETAFKSYEAEPLYNAAQRREAMQKHIEQMKALPEARPGAKLPARVRVQ